MVRDKLVGLIPAAGEGTRLYPFARAVPKEIYPLLGKPVIEHAVENLRMGGIHKIFLIVGYQKGALMDYLGDGSQFNVSIAYIYQLQRRGLGHAILQAKDWINTSFVTLLGDSFVEPKSEVAQLIELHQTKKPLATISVFNVQDPTNYGIAKMNGIEGHSGMIEAMIEKPTPKEAHNYLVGDVYHAICGFYVFEPEIFEYIEQTPPGAKNEIQITDALELAIQSGETVCGHILNGRYLDIGKWHTVLQAEKDLLEAKSLEKYIKDRERLRTQMNQNL
ncbi:MAG: sugar phosphate nucleotidyltransferase [Candidatus Heimdallarchaeota archaeon]